MTGPTLRWVLAAVLTAGLVAGGWLLLADRPFSLPGRNQNAAARLARVRVKRSRRGRVLILNSSSRARGRSETGRGGRGLGARLVDTGRPRSPLSGVDMKGQLPPADAPGAAREFPGRQVLPAASKARRAAARKRSEQFAREALPTTYAPKRRAIPARRAPGAAAARVLAPSRKVPGLGAKRPAGPVRVEVGPSGSRGSAVAPPAADKRLPAPVVPLPLAD